MDFDDTPEEAVFRAEARAWLEAHAAPRTGELHRRVLADEPDTWELQRRWQRSLYDGGWAGITWPKAYGGRDGTVQQASIFAQEQRRFEVSNGLFMVAIDMVGPTLINHADDDLKDRFLDPMLRGDEVWCQLFSEPGAGSDLAGLSTRAERDGDEWVVNGQKVWTSQAHHSDWGILLTRTDPDATKHRGITYFVVDMRSPGIDVRPLRQITGHAHFNEVFLTDVRIPHGQVVGEVNAGWAPTMTTLTSERSAIGGGGGFITWFELRDFAVTSGEAGDRIHRQDLMKAFTRYEILRFLGYRAQTALSRGEAPGPESSVMKLLMSDHISKTGDLVLAMQGAAGALSDDWSHLFLNQWTVKLGGGTDQIQRNVIGERVLGLPGEARVDKTVPFRELAGAVSDRERER